MNACRRWKAPPADATVQRLGVVYAVRSRASQQDGAAAGAVAQQIRPGPGGLTVAASQGDQFLAPVSADPDHHQQAQLVLLQPDAHLDAVGPQVEVVHLRQVPGRERALPGLPLLSQPGDHRR
jgi:hypothetical protein